MAKNEKVVEQEKKTYGNMSQAEREKFKKELVEKERREKGAVPWWYDDGKEEVVKPAPVFEEPAPVVETQPVEEVEPIVEEPVEEQEEVEEEEQPKPAKKKTAPKKKKAPAKKAPAKKAPAKKAVKVAPQVVPVVAPVIPQGSAGYGQYCKYCGRLIPWDSNFCPACGKKLDAPVMPVEENKGVKFAEEERKTFEEQLDALKKKDRALYEELIDYALSKEGARQSDAKYAVTVIVGRYKLIQLLFQRGKLVGKFMAGSSEFKKYSAQEKAVKIKERPVVVEIDSEESVDAAKNLIDITYDNIQEARGKTID